MRCAAVRVRLSDYLGGELPAGRRERLAAHLADCEACSHELGEIEATVALLRRLPPPELPPALADSVMARVRAGEAEPRRAWSWLRRLTEPVLAVPVAAAVVALAVFVTEQRQPSAPVAGVPGGAAADITVAEAPLPSSRPGRELTPTELARSGVGPLEQRRRVRHMRRLDRLERLALRGRSDEVRRILSGAGHPHAPSFVSELESVDPMLAFASFRTTRRR